MEATNQLHWVQQNLTALESPHKQERTQAETNLQGAPDLPRLLISIIASPAGG